MNRVNRVVKAVCLPVIGLSIILAGFAYEVLFAGIPYQDPPPELQAQYDLHGSVAVLFYRAGVIVLLLGLLAIPIIVRRAGKDRPSS